jgi:hypothetical protein
MKLHGLLICVVAALCGIGAEAKGADLTRLQVASRGTVVWAAPIERGERLDVSFIHSQERTLWTQHYRLGDDGALWQQGSTFGSYGAGMPLGRVERTSTGFTDHTTFRVGGVRLLNWKPAHLTLHYRGRAIALDQWFEDYEPFEIRVE